MKRNASNRVLAVVTARGGSKGFPGKNIASFLGLPLIAHSIRFAKMCPEITRCIVSTDSQEIADAARAHGGDVPFIRPGNLAHDKAPIQPVLQHALAFVEKLEGKEYGYIVLLDPTSPARTPEDLASALNKLQGDPRADGIISVSQPYFHPMWHSVVLKKGYMRDLFPSMARVERRQETTTVYRINGALYIWRTAFLRHLKGSWRVKGKHLLYETPEKNAMSFDTAEEFKRAEILVSEGFIKFPWLS